MEAFHDVVQNPAFIPVLALALGSTGIIIGERSERCPHIADWGKFLVYFGAQTGMNLYMKDVLSNSVVETSQEALARGVVIHKDLTGMPAGFAITAIQQIMAFGLFSCFLLVSQFTSCKYTPKTLGSWTDVFAVLLFSLSFILNIALNNYSMTMIPLSVNLIIRSCLPLSTFLSQQLSAWVTGRAVSCRSAEIVLMSLGVVCAAIAVVSEKHGAKEAPGQHNLVYGVIVCIVSLLAGSMNLALAGVLGTMVELNPLDTTVYMAVPATVILLPFVFLWSHPTSSDEWEIVMGSSTMTDWKVLSKVAELHPQTILLTLLSGVFALVYNILQYTIVQTLSATHTAFAGNFNKAATISMSLLLGMESLPEGYWGALMILGVVGNIACFTGYSLAKIQPQEKNRSFKSLETDEMQLQESLNESINVEKESGVCCGTFGDDDSAESSEDQDEESRFRCLRR